MQNSVREMRGVFECGLAEPYAMSLSGATYVRTWVVVI